MRAASSSVNTARHAIPSAKVISTARHVLSLPRFVSNCLGFVESASITLPSVGLNVGSFRSYAATIFAGSRWNLTRQGRSSCAAVSLDRSSGGFIDGIEEGVSIDELVIAGGGTAGKFVFVHCCCARWNEEICDCDAEGISDSLNDVDSNIGGGALDARDCRPGNSGSLCELILGEAGFCPSDDDVDT
jgi:hypothetical protein